MNITELLRFAKKNKASDIHIVSGYPPMLRIHGDMSPLKVAPLQPSDVMEMIHGVMNEKQRIQYEKDLELDFSFQLGKEARFRVNSFTTVAGPAAVFRDIPTIVKTIAELNLPKIFSKFGKLKKGLVLVTGPTGSGKSTTLAAIIDDINSTQSKHILTIEDPVEFVHKSKKSLINQREVGSCTESFARALKSALREDPDVILVGEMRDIETIRLALTAAETGHLVLGTLHTSSAPKTIDRIIDVFPMGDKPMARTMLAGSLEAVIAQLLVKTADGHGRIAVNEILIANSAVRNMIRDNKIPQISSIIQVSSKIGMRLMKDSVHELLDKGLITKEEANITLNNEESQLEEKPSSPDNKQEQTKKEDF